MCRPICKSSYDKMISQEVKAAKFLHKCHFMYVSLTWQNHLRKKNASFADLRNIAIYIFWKVFNNPINHFATYAVFYSKVRLENGRNSKQMITEGEAAIPMETTLHAFRNQEKTKQRSTIGIIWCNTS